MDLLLKLKKAFFLSSSTRRLIHGYALVEKVGPETKTRGLCLPFAGVTEHLLIYPEIALSHSFEQSTHRLLACCGLAGWPF